MPIGVRLPVISLGVAGERPRPKRGKLQVVVHCLTLGDAGGW